MVKAKKPLKKKNIKKTTSKAKVGGSGNFALAKKEKSVKIVKNKKRDSRLRGNDTKKSGNDTKKSGNDTKKSGNDTKKIGNEMKKNKDKKKLTPRNKISKKAIKPAEIKNKKTEIKNKAGAGKQRSDGKDKPKKLNWIHFSKETKRAIQQNSANILSASLKREPIYFGETDKENKQTEIKTNNIFSKEIFGSHKIGSPYFNTLGRKFEIERVMDADNNISLPAGEVNIAEFVGSYSGKKDLAADVSVDAVKEKTVEINFDFSNFSKSPHAVDLRDKNTHEIKQILKGGKVIKSDFTLSAKRAKIKKNKNDGIKPNFLKEDMVLMSLQSKEKIGFWKTLFIPLYTVFKFAEDFFIDLSCVAKGRLPKLLKFSLPLRWKSSLSAFIALCFIIVLPFEVFFIHDASSNKKGKVLGETAYALEELKLGGRSLIENDLSAASEHFSMSLDKFKEAKKDLDNINSLALKIAEETSLDGGRISTGKNLITFGESISRAAVYLNGALIDILGEENNLTEAESLTINENVLDGVNLPQNLMEKIEILSENVGLASAELKTAKASLDNITFGVLSADEQSKLLQVKEFLPLLITSLDEFNGFLDVWSQILGRDSFKRYLIIFQNNYEIRATGGFIGSFALVDVDKGKITNVEIPGGGSYDLQGGLFERTGAPDPLYLISPLWQFHDANWWPDYPTSAKKLMQFYEESGGRTVDGVIAMTPELIIDLLKITGPIAMEEYKEIVDDKNFMWVTQYNVELEYDKEENKPKKFIADLCVKLINKLMEEETALNGRGLGELFNILGSSVNKKDLQLYFTDDNFQNFAKKYSLAGNIKDSSGDYLMVVNTNIGGGKSDSVISQDMDLASRIGDDGSIVNKLTITRTHNGNKDDYFQKARNVNWMRIYVPEGASLISASGFKKLEGKYFKEPIGELAIDSDIAELEGGFELHGESGTRIYNQFNKTVFANWSMIDLGETAEIVIEYKLPFKAIKKNEPEKSSIFNKILSLGENKEDTKDFRSHTILAQKQAGINSDFNYSLTVPENWGTVWSNNTFDGFDGKLDEDNIFGRIFEVR